MKKILSVILTVIITFSCLCFGGADMPFSSGIAAKAVNFETESGVQVEMAPFLYKSTLYQMEFPNREDYSIKEKSQPGDYAISRELNDTSYTFVFPAGTTKIECMLSLDGETGWRGFWISDEKNPSYWEKDEEGNVDHTKPLTFVRSKTTAERDEYGMVYRDHLNGKDVGGFKDYDKLYWRLRYTCNNEEFADYFEIKLYDYDNAEKHTVKAVNYNVAGLPFGFFKGENVPANQKVSAEYLSSDDFDIVAIQEDFGYHNELVENMTGYDYSTHHTGGIPGGDGLNIFTKNMPVYNETRVPWNEACGILADGSDALTPKGFVYSVIDVGNGIYVDFYNLHADAYGGDGSIAARTSQYRQLAEFIEARSAEHDRPVIITGDFNNYLHTHEDDGALYKTLCVEGGFKDAWIEYHNDGEYFNLHQWYQTGLPCWGNWDSVERFMYRPGGGVDIVISDFKYTQVCDESGHVVSDHNSAECEFTFVKMPDFEEKNQDLQVAQAPETNILHQIEWIFKALFLVLSDLANVPEMIKDLFD